MNANTKNTNANLLEIVKDITSLKVDVASLKTTVRLLVAAMLIMISAMGWGFNFLQGEIKQVETDVKRVETMVAKTNEIAIRTEAKFDAFLQYNVALQSGDPVAIDAARRALIDLLAETASTTTTTPTSPSEKISFDLVDPASELKYKNSVDFDLASNACYVMPNTLNTNTNIPINLPTKLMKEKTHVSI